MQHMVFSSSCTVYGEPERVPIDEKCSLNSTTSPYARTKVMCETILRDLCAAAEDIDVCMLRYFNPVAAHPSGLIGEHPIGVPQNLMPFVQQVASGKRPVLKVFGNDYNTRDGTTVRDYIHVMDLAAAHVAGATPLYLKQFAESKTS
jgi:UDP-glucose 4-epimerase